MDYLIRYFLVIVLLIGFAWVVEYFVEEVRKERRKNADRKMHEEIERWVRNHD